MAAPAHAEDPSLNESDMDDSVPAEDDSYLEDEYSSDENTTSSDDSTGNETTESSTDDSTSDGSDPTLSDSDFDSSVPAGDDDYLSDEYDLVDPRMAGDGADASPSGSGASDDAQVPGPAGALLVGAAVAAAIGLGRRSR